MYYKNERVDEIKSRLGELEEEQKKLNIELEQIQKECKHEETYSHDFPFGNKYFSFKFCKHCGKLLEK